MYVEVTHTKGSEPNEQFEKSLTFILVAFLRGTRKAFLRDTYGIAQSFHKPLDFAE